MDRLLAVVLLLCVFLMAACAHPVPENRCDDVVEIRGPDDAYVTVARACERFAESTGVTTDEMRKALQNTQVLVMEWPHRPPCDGSPGCAQIMSNRAHVYVSRDEWRRYLSHEIYHILLVRLEPDLPVEDHHRRMRELSLCTNGVCGGFHPPCRGLSGGMVQCNSLL